MKSLRISVAIVITFLFCWTPYYVLMIVSIFINDDVEDLATAIFFFGMSNSLFNPAIYGIFHLYRPKKKEFQRGSSSKKTLLTNVSIQRGRSATVAARTASSHLPGHHQQSIRMNSVTTTTEVNGNIALTKKSPNGNHHVVIPYIPSSSSSEHTKEEFVQTTAI